MALAGTRDRAGESNRLTGIRLCGDHYGQRPCDAPHQQAEYMAAPTSKANQRKSLPKRSHPYMAHHWLYGQWFRELR